MTKEQLKELKDAIKAKNAEVSLAKKASREAETTYTKTVKVLTKVGGELERLKAKLPK